MREQAIIALAEYLTGPLVARMSIGLGVPDGPMGVRDSAERFFTLRAAFGVQGYDTKKEAERAIRQVVGGGR